MKLLRLRVVWEYDIRLVGWCDNFVIRQVL